MRKKYYDHILRESDRWEAVAWYVWMNPVRPGLCARPQGWAFSGSFKVDWHALLAPPDDAWIPRWKQRLRDRGHPQLGKPLPYHAGLKAAATATPV